MYVIKRLWIDTLENRDAYGFSTIGFVTNLEEKNRICSLEKVPKSKYPYPLESAYEFPGDFVPMFIAIEVPNLDGADLGTLLRATVPVAGEQIMEPLKYPRPCEITSNQFHAEGLCLEIKNGVALVESQYGTVSYYNLYSCYSIKFLDRAPDGGFQIGRGVRNLITTEQDDADGNL